MLGSPRSGTTWLAKIFDSHPATLYRHEPDETSPALDRALPATQLAAWIGHRSLRATAKRPWFRKDWRGPGLEAVWRGLVLGHAILQRLPLVGPLAAAAGVRDLVAPRSWRDVRAVLKLVNWNGALVSRTMPDTRCVFILRHPCGQVASILAGRASRRFADQVDDADARHALSPAAALAAAHGVDRAAFDRLPDAAKYAWAWIAFNQPTVEAMSNASNARIVLYEDLCGNPASVSKDLFAFADLTWNPQTAAFLADSTRRHRAAGYYDVYRVTQGTAERWRQTMSQQDQDAVRAVVRGFPLVRLWPDLAALSGDT